MGKYFGTDGIRGVVNRELDCLLAYKAGFAAATVLTRALSHRAKIFIGRDTRISGEMLEAALAAGICAAGADAVLLGVIPTPAVAFLTLALLLTTPSNTTASKFSAETAASSPMSWKPRWKR